MNMKEEHLKEAQDIAYKVTKSLTGSGIWGVEFLLQKMALFFRVIPGGLMIQDGYLVNTQISLNLNYTLERF